MLPTIYPVKSLIARYSDNFNSFTSMKSSMFAFFLNKISKGQTMQIYSSYLPRGQIILTSTVWRDRKQWLIVYTTLSIIVSCLFIRLEPLHSYVFLRCL